MRLKPRKGSAPGLLLYPYDDRNEISFIMGNYSGLIWNRDSVPLYKTDKKNLTCLYYKKRKNW
jgi:hypothetical protein